MSASGISLLGSSGRGLHFETKSNWSLFGIQLSYWLNKLLESLINIDMILFPLAGPCKNSTLRLNDASLCCLCHSVQQRKKPWSEPASTWKFNVCFWIFSKHVSKRSWTYFMQRDSSPISHKASGPCLGFPLPKGEDMMCSTIINCNGYSLVCACSVCFLLHQTSSELKVKLTLFAAPENTACPWVGHKEWRELSKAGRPGREVAELVLKLNWVLFADVLKGIK